LAYKKTTQLAKQTANYFLMINTDVTMNSRRLNLKTILTFLSAGPLIIGSLLLILSFSLIHIKLSNDTENIVDDMTEIFFNNIQTDTLNNHESFKHIANQLLALGPYTSISLLDENLNTIINTGIPTNEEYINSINTHTDIYIKNKRYRLITLNTQAQNIPKKTTSSLNFKYNLLIVTDQSGISIRNHQWALIITLLFFGIIILAYIYHKKINHEVFVPLSQLNTVLDEIIKNKATRIINIYDKSIYKNLIEKINQLFNLQNELNQQLQNNMEITTKELRESLETLEIRNIELDIARKKALELTKLKSEFLANTSHEIRTPLNGIIGFSELLKKTSLDNDQLDHLSTIEDSAKGLLTIISDILDFSRMETGKLNLEYKPFVFINTIEDALILQAPNANEKNIKIHFIPNNDIPQQMYGDPLRLQQVVSNLVANAIKFSDSGSVIVYCQKLNRDDNKISLKFIVKDNGIGLDLQHTDKLFDSFSQAQNSNNRRYPGAGLGLTIAKGLVQRMDGDIGVESEKGKGSSFWFTITLGKNNETRELFNYISTLTHVNVLLFDNDDIGNVEISSKLNLWGAITHTVDNFNKIIESAKNLTYKSKKYTRFYPAAIINAQTENNVLDTEKLKQTIIELSITLKMPTVVITPPGKYASISSLLNDTPAILLQRPINSSKLYKAIFNQLGIFERKPTLPHNTSENHTPSKEKINVLIVDDNLANLKLAKELLKEFNTQIDTATSGKEALNFTKHQPYDLILMDIQMPDMNGYETTKLIRKKEEKNQRTPIIALTAHAVAEEKTKILLSGMDDFLSKPVSSADLSHIIDRWVIKNSIKKSISLHSNDKTSKPAEYIKDEKTQKKSSSPVNIKQSLELSKNKSDLAKDMLQMLIESLVNDKKQIYMYYENKNYSQLHEVVHKLHGGCCYCGVPILLAAAKQADKSLQNDKKDNLEQEITTLLTAIDELLEWNNEHDLGILFDTTNSK